MTLVLLAASVFAATVPMLGFLAIVWWLDHYDREPLPLLGVAYLWGAVGAVTLACAGNTFGVYAMAQAFHFKPEQGAGAGALLLAPLIEEPMKATILLLVSRSRHFDNATDGFVYGAAAGLGFATTENFTYFASAAAQGPGAWLAVVVIRTLFSGVMHALATSIVGAALGWFRYSRALDQLGTGLAGLAVAIMVHATWNGLLVADPALHADGALAVMDFLVFPFEFAVAFSVFQVCLWHERSILQRYLQDEAERGTLPAAHVPILASWLKRTTANWLPPGVARDRYIRTATTLAFRRHQSERAVGSDRVWAEAEVLGLRRALHALTEVPSA